MARTVFIGNNTLIFEFAMQLFDRKLTGCYYRRYQISTSFADNEFDHHGWHNQELKQLPVHSRAYAEMHSQP
jgi:hypothetical protein